MERELHSRRTMLGQRQTPITGLTSCSVRLLGGLRSPAEAGHYGSRGFSLIEVMVATTVFVVGVVGLAPLFLLAARATSLARTTTYAAVLAQEKMEQLRSLSWGFDAFNQPISDTTTDVTSEPEALAGGTGLSPSPADALSRNTAGYCDFVDANGRSLGGGTTPPAGAAFVRRWSIEPLSANPDHTIVIQVLVMRLRAGAIERRSGAARQPEEARIVSVKTRRAS